MTAAVSDAVKVRWSPAAGAGSPQHLLDVLTTGHADAARGGSIFHFGRTRSGRSSEFLGEHGVPVRLV